MKPRLFAARVAARILLTRIWDASEGHEPMEVLNGALEAAAKRLGLTVARVPDILGGRDIAGFLDRNQKRVEISVRYHPTSQRFTFAHEIAHFVLHPGEVYFRDRELSAPGQHREYFELEADAFAAEFLMPRNYLKTVFFAMFGAPIDGTHENPELLFSLKAGSTNPKDWTPEEFANGSPLTRALEIAAAQTYKGRFFLPLTEHFNVSKKAMAIQLIQSGMVT